MKTDSAFVAVEGIPYSADRLYEYAVPDDLADLVGEGSVVLCPFGKADRLHRGVVLRVGAREAEVIKPLAMVTDTAALPDKTSLRLADYVHEKYFCTYFDAIRAVMPPGLFGALDRYYTATDGFFDEELKAYFDANGGTVERRKLMKDLGKTRYARVLRALRDGTVTETFRKTGSVKPRTVQGVSRGEAYEAVCDELRSKKGVQAAKTLHILEAVGGEAVAVQAFCRENDTSPSVLKNLEKKSAVALMPIEIGRSVSASFKSEGVEPIALTGEQQKAFDEIRASFGTGRTHLLYGVTGSGKTAVFMALIDAVLREGRTALVLVPEISITMQTVDVFCRRYGSGIAVLHSGLSAGERFDEWRRIASGEVRIVIGTRSAVFAPLKDLGLIIADEEQEHTYRSEMTPKYDAVEVAAMRAKEQKILFLVASATPSFERYRAAREGKIGLSVLSKRYNEKPLPKTVVVDMTKETSEGNSSLFSRTLAQEIEKNRRAGEQTVLFMNRRGYSSFVSCPQCKFVFSCKSCGIPLTYHRASGKLVCHYCGYTQKAPDLCPQCGCHTIKYSGAGTQKAEEELKRFFPDLRIVRMDADTVGRKDARDSILKAFRRHEYDVLLGTQMITKGLDFPDVTLVGVLNADSMLYSSDFRAYEKTFDVITQVVGRAGRAEKEGRAVIQTYSPAHTVLAFAFDQNFEGFYAQESGLRKMLLYPPFCDICQVVFLAETVDRAFAAAEEWISLVSGAVATEPYAKLPVSIIRPRETAVPMDHGLHRVRVLIKCSDIKPTRRMLAEIYRTFVRRSENKDVTVDMTMNPSVIV